MSKRTLSPPADAPTLAVLLRRRADAQPDRRIFTFLLDGDADARSLTYAELDRQAKAVAGMLQQVAAPGDRALLLFQPGLDYIAAFFGCLYAGVVAVPAYPPQPNRPVPRLRTIIADARPRVALTSAPILESLRRRFDDLPDLAALRWLTPASEAGADPGWRAPDLRGETLAFLQYTSGSTAAPKGVMLTHANLLHNLALIQRCCGHTPESRGVSWLPPYHDMGLIGGVLQPIYSDFPATLMSPVAFLQRPLRWLQAIARTGANISGGPNFAYDLCVRKITPDQRAALDLRSWELAFNGAEPVRAETLDRFVEAFGPCGFRREAFYPCYGLAEATLIVSGGAKGSAPVARAFAEAALSRNRAVVARAGQAGRTLVGCGRPLEGQRALIVHPETRARCAPGQVGEIWVAGPSVAQGYWDHPAETEQAFRARLAAGDDGPFLRTGDLGFLHRGELFVAGRLKDLIIIRGRNHYPQDIEQTAERAHPALQPSAGAAFAVERDGIERLAIVHEVARTHRRADVAEVAAAIRRAVADEHDLQVYAVALIAPGSIPKTSSGKIQRHACRAGFLEDRLALIGRSVLDDRADAPDDAGPLHAPALTRAALLALAPAARRPAVERYLAEQVARALRVAPESIDLRQPLSALGLDSLAAIELKNEVETALGAVVPLEDFFQADAGLLAGALLARMDDRAAPPILPDAAPQDAYPLSVGQRALWFLHQLAPESAAYNIMSAVRLCGELDVPALRRAFQKLAERHPALRTVFAARDGEPFQRILADAAIDLPCEDATGWSAADLDARMSAEAHRPFDLARGPLLRIALFRRAAREHVLLLVVHHIVTDLWSMAVLARDLAALYLDAQAVLPPPALRYADYVRWQADLLGSAAGERMWRYWRDQLGDASGRGAPPALDLPTDRPRGISQHQRGATHAFRLAAPQPERIEALARRSGATSYTLLLAAFLALIERYSGQTDIVVGSPAAGRDRAGFADLIGYFVNPLALRADLAGDPAFADLLGRVRETVRGALAHQDYPFAALVERLRPARDPGRSPLFQVMFVMQRAPSLGQTDISAFALGDGAAHARMGDLRLEAVALEQRVAQFDLTLELAASGGDLAARWQYDADLFDATTIMRMARHFQTLLGGIVAAPGRRLSALPMLTPIERQQLIDWNAGAAPAIGEATFQQLFEAQAARTPDAVALAFDDPTEGGTTNGESECSSLVVRPLPIHLTYDELNRRANQLAHHLRARGVGPEVCVGLSLPRSPDLVAALLGVLKAGGAYLPLDPAYPAERLAFMREDSRATTIVTKGGISVQGSVVRGRDNDRLFPELRSPTPDPWTMVDLAADWEAIARYPATNPPGSAPLDQLAYVIYTSGSTGRPKGALLTQRGLANLAAAQARTFGLSARSRVLQFASLSFDASLFELLLALPQGATIVLAPAEALLPGEALLRLLRRQAIDVATLPPSLLAELDPAALPGLRTLISAGEALSGDLARRWAAGRGLFNAYGPTEMTIWATVVRCEAADRRPPAIGRPIARTQAYVLDRRLHPTPAGVIGELYLGGVGLARGYHGRPDLTAERFIPNPFAQGSGVGGQGSDWKPRDPEPRLPIPDPRLYKTGDLARYRPDGSIEYLGRIDQQVKIRGQRIELGEVEAALARHPAVRACAVVARADRFGEARLAAYVVTSGELQGTSNIAEDRRSRIENSNAAVAAPLSSTLDPRSAELRAFLARTLPAAMIPSAFVDLAALPATPNGKIDRRALPDPSGWPDQPGSYAHPRTPAEAALAAIWAETLGLERVGVHDDFFALGGHSLLATRLAARVRERLLVDLPLRRLFETPTIAGLAPLIERANAPDRQDPPIPRAARDAEIPLSFAQQRLWFLDQLQPGGSAYTIPIALRFAGALDVGALRWSIGAIVARHEALRTTFHAPAGRPIQRIAPARRAALPVADLRALPEEVRAAAAQALGARAALIPFDLARGPLIRAALLRMAATEHVLLVSIHHIVADGWSLSVFVSELAALYAARARGRPDPLPDPPIQYADYAIWQRERMDGDALARLRDAWLARLEGAPLMLALPADRPPRSGPALPSARLTRTVPRALADALAGLARDEQASLFMPLLAAFGLLLHRHTRQTDLLIGTPVAGRAHLALEPLIGCFVNTLVVRLDLAGAPSFRELLARVRDACLDAYALQDYPFEQLVEALHPARDANRPPVVQALFNMLNLPQPALDLPDLSLDLLTPPDIDAKLDLTLYVREQPDGLNLALSFAAERFAAARMADLLDQYAQLLAQVAADPDRPISRFTLRTPAAALRLPDPAAPLALEWPGPVFAPPAAHARRAPDRMAASDEQGSWSYADLEEISNRLAHALRAHGLGSEDRVAIVARRAAALVPALLGVLKAGSAFVILDAAHPPVRLAAMLDLARPRALIQLGDEAPLDAPSAAPLYRLGFPATPDAARSLLAAYPATPPGVAVHPEQLAYLAFTSGSSGAPKMIAGAHRPLAHFVAWQARSFALSPDDRFGMLSGLGHDPLLRDIFTPLWLGAALCAPDPAQMLTPGYLADWLRRREISVLHTTPALGQVIAGDAADGALPALRYVFSGGAPLGAALAAQLRRIAPNATVVNGYGATETPQLVGAFVAPPGVDAAALALGDGSLPLGQGCAGAQLLIESAAGAPAGIGEIGEIVVRTPYLARGYAGDPALTAERFVPDPFTPPNTYAVETQDIASLPRTRRYKTGDLGWYTAEGQAVYAGRADRQAQIRGYRVEPAEVAAALRTHPAVRAVAVAARADGAGDMRLVAYIVTSNEFGVMSNPGATSDQRPTKDDGPSSFVLRPSSFIAELRDWLSARLPSYMLPSAFVALDALPLTPNGKIDERALPAPERDGAQRPITPPRTPTEEAVAAIWRELLGVERAGVDDSFFDLGGHSLLATQLLSRIRAAFQVDLPLLRLFETPTIAGVAAAIEQARAAGAATSEPAIGRASRDLYRVRAASRRAVAAPEILKKREG